MNEFAHDSIKPFSDKESKKKQVSAMFDAIAYRYDFMNTFLSAGIDVLWRKKAVNILKKTNPQSILDVAAGTGDLSIMAAKTLQSKKIIGIDISEQMLAIGRKKIEKQGLNDLIKLQTGDGEAINFPDNSFDAVMVAFGVRNFENLEKGLQEIHRVMRPSGKLMILEFSKPVIPGIKNLYNLYMGIIAPQIAGWFTHNKKAYQYLNKSARAFPDRKLFIEILNKTGYKQTSFISLSLGICCIYEGRKD
jgi:demethylmenaquinone methyltransferase/2-methoxy-6-polyprenyl-1,4-benzoquinol methylase